MALARAIATRPRVLLLDEPLTALDARLRETLRTDINGLLRGLGITAVYVTHDQAEAMALGDRIPVMDRGVIAQIGTPQDIYFRPANAFVADFIGTMNLVNGQRFRPEDVELVSPDAATLRGKVLSCFFLGDHQRIHLGMETGEVEPGELVARIRAVLRRAPVRDAGAAVVPNQPCVFRFADWRLDTGSRELRHADGVLVPLSTSEYRLLCVFLTHPRTVLSREQLVERAHKRELLPTDRSMDIQIHRLRQRLRDAGDSQLFKTVRHIGYALDADVEAVFADA